MIVRGSRRKLQRHASRALQSSLEQLQLPWLCPAFFERPRQQQTSRRSTSSLSRGSSPLPARRSQSPRRAVPVSKSTDRGFATPATAIDYHEEFVPFDHRSHTAPQSTPQTSWQSQQSLADLLPVDPNATQKIPDDLTETTRRFNPKNGLGGDITNIHSILQAYLDVGQLERASMTIRRLHDIYNVGEPELFQAHLAYIATVVSNIMITGDSTLVRHLDRWFNEDVRAKGIKPNGTMIRLLIQGAFGEAIQRKIQRNIRRYLHGAKREGVLEESVHELSQFLTEDEFRSIREASPEYFDGLTSEPVPAAMEPLQEDSTIPAVLAQQQKGLGLVALRKSLSVFSDPANSPVRNALKGEDIHAWRQARLESDTVASAMDRWRADHEETMKRSGAHTGIQNRKVGALMWRWHEALIPLVKEEIKKLKTLNKEDCANQMEMQRMHYGPFLQYLTPEKLSAITILTAIHQVSRKDMKGGVPLAKLVSTIGSSIEEESAAEILKARNQQWMAQKMSAVQRQRSLSIFVKHEQGLQKGKSSNVVHPSQFLSGDIPAWSGEIQAQVGVIMFSLLVQASEVKVPIQEDGVRHSFCEEAAFINKVEFIEGRKIGLVRLHEHASKMIAREPVGSAIAKHLPMLTKPVPWTGFSKGGFMNQPVEVVRSASYSPLTKDYIELASESGDMKQVFAGLDVLGRTPWKINRAVFDVMIDVWNTGEAVANIPASNPQFEYPSEPLDKEDIAARRLYAYKCKTLDNQRDGMHSNRCFQNFQLEVARAFLNETFYLPHNMDFRGRAYPLPPYLNHMGADHCRGLLTFGKGKPLGETGMMWLRVHLANVYGFDKASLIERRDFATKHLSDIYDSATNPMGGKRWWLGAEDPWQCLAACFELKAALDSPDPLKYVSSLPIHQDGTCNGLQHYAALGGDALGAKQVNLEPGERPADIYTAVAQSVAESVAHDAQAGDELAKVLEGKVSRKVVKQTVMTNVYGVTFAGARTQIKNRLKELYPELFADSSERGFYAASYLARKTFEALSAMFSGAHDIQYWLGECASRICESFTPQQIEQFERINAGEVMNEPYKKVPTNHRAFKDEKERFKSSVIWTTPLKMPVVQPYRKAKSKLVKTNLQHISLIEPSKSDPVSKRKQLQAFPPNFIHSLDATHMFLSAIKCDELGLTFAAVHDSFWTHAGDIDTMNTVLRDAFVRMHSEDIVTRLAAEFAARYEGHMYLASVDGNTELGKKIAKLGSGAVKVKAKARIDDLLTERKRQRLLASEDPTERAEGGAMITAAKIFEERTSDDDVVVVQKLYGAIGEIQPGELESSAEVEASPTDADAAIIEEPEGELVESAESEAEEKPFKRKRRQVAYKPKVYFWMPMSFPPVPKKGDFDVTRLKESKYFFS